MYNWDEKGFLMGISNVVRRIMTKKEYESGRITSAKQDGLREFISLLACICGDGTKLPPALIYTGTNGDLLDSWFDQLEDSDQAFFGFSDNGWSSDQFGLNWLKNIFDPHTSKKAGRGRRLLIVDGHSSHVNWEFVMTCDRLKILFCILSPHTTQKLHPLDVGMFRPLSTNYTIEQNYVMQLGESWVSLSKRMFWPMFKKAWNDSFHKKNIKNAWKKVGIIPRDANRVISIVTARPTTPLENESIRTRLKTPLTSKAMRQYTRDYWKNPHPNKVCTLMKANETLQGRVAIAEHRVAQFQEAMKLETYRRKRGKRLDLLGKEKTNKCQWFGVEEIQDGKARRDALEQTEKDKIEEKKLASVAAAIQKEEEEQRKREEALQQDIARQERIERDRLVVI